MPPVPLFPAGISFSTALFIEIPLFFFFNVSDNKREYPMIKGFIPHGFKVHLPSAKYLSDYNTNPVSIVKLNS